MNTSSLVFRFHFLLFVVAFGTIAAQTEIIVHDPVAIKEDNTYHLFCTGDGISHFSSQDLQNWQKEPAIFIQKPSWTEQVVPNFKNHIWAPDVIQRNGLYYVYYSVSAFAKNTSAIGVVTGKTLNPKSKDYGWTDHGIVIQSHPNRDLWNAIDPNIVFDENDIPWMCFGSFWNGLKLVKMDESLIKIAEPQEWYTIARRERSFDLPDEDPGNAALEAPFIFKKNGWYYLFVSWDYCCRGDKSTYKVVAGRSKNVTGPYLDKDGKNLFDGGGSLIVEGNDDWYGTGHCSAYTFNDQDYLFFHGYDARDGAKPKLIIKEITWDKNNWPVQLNP